MTSGRSIFRLFILFVCAYTHTRVHTHTHTTHNTQHTAHNTHTHQVCATYNFEAAAQRTGLAQTIDRSVPIQPTGFASPILFSEADLDVVLPLDEKRHARKAAAAAKKAKEAK